MPIGGSISEYIPIGGSNNADVQACSPNTVGSGSAQYAKKRYFCKPILFRASLELQRWSRRNLDLNSREIMAKPVFGRLKRNLYSKFDNAYVLTYLTLSRRTTSLRPARQFKYSISTEGDLVRSTSATLIAKDETEDEKDRVHTKRWKRR